MEIVLASKSPRRQELLKTAVPEFSVMVPEFDEGPVMAAGLCPEETVRRLSLGKALAARERFGAIPERIYISGDTVVVSPEGEIMGKPRDRDDAFRMLRALSGRSHTVYTGVAVLYRGGVHTFAEGTEVRFRPLTDRLIAEYIDSGEPMDKAGAYGVQGQGALLVERIDGDFFNVMGLPVLLVSRMLQEFGITLLS